MVKDSVVKHSKSEFNVNKSSYNYNGVLLIF